MLSLNTGDTDFVMLCTALVCMMTPALALFYGGMVRKKNVLTIMMQNFISMGVTAIIWIFGGFSSLSGRMWAACSATSATTSRWIRWGSLRAPSMRALCLSSCSLLTSLCLPSSLRR